MPAGGDAAVGYAARLGEIHFPEFTCKLVTDTFDALISANIRQQQAFIELLQATSKSLKDYINDTKDDIGPGEIMQLLSAAVPPDNPDANSAPTKAVQGATLTQGEVDTLNKALEVKDAGLTDDNKAATKTVDAVKLNEAVAIRIAANKYTLLTEMVKLGMLRLVIDDGTIETRLNFHAYGSDYFATRSSDYSRSSFDFRARAKTGGILSAWVNASASTAYSTVKVSTVDTSSGSDSGVDVNIYGGVKINFHTDYVPLKTS